MRWERPFLAAAAANNFAWAVAFAVAPERLYARMPPVRGLDVTLVAAVGACFALNVVRRSPAALWIGLAAKICGPAVFLFAVASGLARAASWPLVLLTDVMWIPPLVVLSRRRTSW